MNFNSITIKLQIAIVTVFLLVITGVFILADLQIKRILDRSQEAAYAERIESILHIINRNHEQLKKTLLVDTYLDDFQYSSLDFIKDNYYRPKDLAIYPFVLDNKGAVVLHPNLPGGDLSLGTIWMKGKRKEPTSPDTPYMIHQDQDYWRIIKSFEPWGWKVGYAVPVEIFYHDARDFGTILLGIVCGAAFLMVALTALVVSRFTVPIKNLTEAAQQIEGGNLEYQVDLSAGDEVGVLARSFDNMRTAVKKQIADLNYEVGERKRAEQAHAEGGRILRLVLDSIPVRVFWKDTNCAYLGANEPFVKDAGLESTEELIGKTDFELPWSEEQTTFFRQNDLLVMGSGSPVYDIEEQHTQLNGEVRWLQTNKVPMLDVNGSVIGVLGTSQDITERKQVDRELFRLREYLSSIIDSMPSIIVGVSAKGVITQWNLQAKKCLGISSEEVVGKPLNDLLAKFQVDMNLVRKSIDTGSKYHASKKGREEAGKTHYESITIYPLEDRGIGGAVIRIDDETDRVQLEELIVQNEKMISVGGLAAGMAHEINNPLSGITLTISVLTNRLGRELDNPDNVRAAEEAGVSMEGIKQFMESRDIPRMLSAITETGRRLTTLINNMLSFARKSDAEFPLCSIEELLDTTLELANTDFNLKENYDFKKIAIERRYYGELPPVPCDKGKIQQVLLNILKNGAEAMQLANTRHPRFILHTLLDPDKPMVRIEIEDNGPGLERNESKRIFEPFFTTKPVGVGTGLGLSVAYFIITENHCGEISVESQPGKYTKFIICLPLVKV